MGMIEDKCWMQRQTLASSCLLDSFSPSFMKLTEVQEKSRAETDWHKLFKDVAVSKKNPKGLCL